MGSLLHLNQCKIEIVLKKEKNRSHQVQKCIDVCKLDKMSRVFIVCSFVCFKLFFCFFLNTPIFLMAIVTFVIASHIDP